MMSGSSPKSPEGTNGRKVEGGETLHRLDMTSFKKRNSAILPHLEAQEEERNALWAALQQARHDGERLRQEELALATDEDAEVVGVADSKELEERAPTSAELIAMLSPESLNAEAATPSRFAARSSPRRSDDDLGVEQMRSDHPAVIASGFICPTCWMRAPSAEVLRRHDEEVHQTPLERAANRVLDNSGSLGNMTRVAYRKIRRSLSVRPQTTNDDRPDDATLLAATRQARFEPATPSRAAGADRQRRYSMPPNTPVSGADTDEVKSPAPSDDALPTAGHSARERRGHRSRWKRTQVV
ncbi:hypothetical protein CTAYLR_002718 [Chrysophaeum taylorii]|uniref:Uncharacterized protein n=1 Tax=Chrysophaeum taylorii TaxID=2483200 RepID=A0AAD7UC11_9STRA|nr:hypothetical protein CTAYLR_002718 [Chrysophaeum taylorii]